MLDHLLDPLQDAGAPLFSIDRERCPSVQCHTLTEFCIPTYVKHHKRLLHLAKGGERISDVQLPEHAAEHHRWCGHMGTQDLIGLLAQMRIRQGAVWADLLSEGNAP